MKELKALVGLPFARPDGRLVDYPGYDETTGVYVDFPIGSIAPVPTNPDQEEVIQALRTIWKPWSGYNFSTPHDRAAMLAAIITAICRPSLATSPGFFFDAPVQGSGKTKCAGALGAIIRGRPGGVSPFVDGAGAEAEISKKLVAMSMVDEDFWLIDNVVGVWRSPVIAALITDGVLHERLLGSNSWYRGDVRMMICATGNNATLDRDLVRRFIRVRIDPGTELPQSRSFEFDPIDEALSGRMSIARSVLVLIQAFWNSKETALGRGDVGFSVWNRLIRNCVLWTGQSGMAEHAGLGSLGDPAFSILEEAGVDDPDTTAYRMLLHGLEKIFSNDTFKAKDIVTLVDNGGISSDEGVNLIHESLSSLLAGRKEITAVSIGKVLRFRRDRIVDGLALRQEGLDRNGVAVWFVEHVQERGGKGMREYIFLDK